MSAKARRGSHVVLFMVPLGLLEGLGWEVMQCCLWFRLVFWKG